MTFLANAAVDRLTAVLHEPDLGGTKYRLLREAGAGGMGTVWEAEDVELGRRVALKVLDVPDPRGELARRLSFEARILARLEHPGIVPVHDVGTLPDGRPFYAMKLVQGERLDEHLARVPALTDRLRLFLRICEPLAFAHAQGVLHRDVKPENVMVGPFGEVLVMDWGIARSADEVAPPTEEEQAPIGPSPSRPGRLTASGTVLGTPGYMAPEQERGDVTSLDARADVHALGALLRTMAQGASPRLDRRLAAICAKATAPAREDRYRDVTSLAADVARFIDGAPVEAYRERPWETAWRLLVKHRVAVILVLTYLAARALVLVVYRR